VEHETVLLAAVAATLWGAAAITLLRSRRSGRGQVLAVAAAGATVAAVNSVQLRRQGDRYRDLLLSAADLRRENEAPCRYPGGTVQRLRPVAPLA
jgi:hypothetical protein